VRSKPTRNSPADGPSGHLALIFVLGIAFGAAFLVESLDPRIKRAEEIEELYGIPVVATFGSKA